MDHLASTLLQAVLSIDTDLVLLAVLLVAGLIILHGLYGSAETKRKDSGMTKGSIAVSIDGSKTLVVRHYVSELQGLAGKPDAVINEEGNIVPVERKPLARKIRDRYVAQLLVYMRLIEEFEGKKPPYGYLLLGPSCRRFRIENSPERQAWLQGIIDEMSAIAQGAPCTAAPHIRKCVRCDVKEHCAFKILPDEYAKTPDTVS